MENKTMVPLQKRPPDMIFILILLCILSFGSFMMIVLGSNVYKTVTGVTDDNAQLRTVLSYITTKVRQNDGAHNVVLKRKDGTTALVLRTEEGGKTYYTWIYEYGGYLREAYVDAQPQFALSDGPALLRSYGLKLSKDKGGRLHVKAFDQRGRGLETVLSLRSEGELGYMGGEFNEK